MKGMITVATHSGNFHPDEVFAIATLQLYLGKENLEIIRTRDDSVIKEAVWVVDVGGVYDAVNNRFDHHQLGAPVRENGLPYSAFGLVWKHYGEFVAGTTEAAESVERQLVLPIDAGDNGVNLYTLNDMQLAPAELFSVVSSYRPVWGSDESWDDAFMKAVAFAYDLLVRNIDQAKAALKQKEFVQSVYEQALNKSIIELPMSVNRNAFVEYGDVKVIVYPSASDEGERWKAEVIPKKYNSFENRVLFPLNWGGLRDEELAKVSGLSSAIFCHKACYLFAAWDREDVLKAAEYALQYESFDVEFDEVRVGEVV
ncbi:MYG1 family protein [Candidatus Kaiserbacteria bacterium]|nr:MYG1 family protein [Candidatus Kaiserbacteria bacterium]